MNRRLLLACAAVFLALFAAYVHTLNPAFRADDSPETIASCVTLGIQHPPGYPLHTMVGRIFALVPEGAPAWRINMMAAFFGALSATLIMAIAYLWSGHITAAALAALLLGLSPTYWSQSLAAKGGIYTFHASFLALLLLSLTLWGQDMASRLERAQSSRLRLLQSRWFLLSVLALFVGFGNHWESQSLFLPAAAAWVFFFFKSATVDLKMPKGSGLFSPLLKAALLAAAGLSIYLYLPIRSSQHPPMNWGEPHSWKQFWWVVLRHEYLDLEVGFLKALKAALIGPGSWSEVAETWVYVERQIIRVAGHLLFPGDLSLAGTGLAFLGSWTLWKSRRLKELGFSLGLIASFSFVIAFYFHLKAEMIWIMDVFLIPAYMMQALLAAVGLAWLLERAPKIPFRPYALAGLFAAVFMVIFTLRAPTVSQAQHFWAWDYGKNFLLSLKRNAVVLAEGDFNTMPIYYLQHVKGERPDVRHVTTIFASTAWGVDALKREAPELGISIIPKVDPNLKVGDGALLRSVLTEIIQNSHGKRPLHASLFRQVQSENLPAFEPLMSPSGLSAELSAPESKEQWLRRLNLPRVMVHRYLPDEKSRYEHSPEFALSNYGTLYMDLANFMRNKGMASEAMPLYERAIEITTKPNLAEAYTHWGIAYTSMNRPELAIEKFTRAIAVKPLFEAYANLAGVLNQLKRYDEAEAHARKAVELQPNNGQSWNNLAISLYYRGKTAEAVQALETAALKNPGDMTIQNNLRALKGGK